MKTASTGNEMISTEFTIRGGAFNNRKVWTNFVMTQGAVKFLMDFLIQVKSPLVDSEDAAYDAIALDMVGKQASAYIAGAGETPGGSAKYTIGKYKDLIAVPEGVTAGAGSGAKKEKDPFDE